jgi:hypothetical protein
MGGATRKMGAKMPSKMEEGGAHPNPSGDAGAGSELHSHGDGTYHTMIDGQKTEHPSFGHAAMHLAAHHEAENTQSHVHHHEDGTHTSHHMKDGQVDGPHDHDNLEALKGHLGKFLNEEEHEGSDYGKEESGSDGLFGE